MRWCSFKSPDLRFPSGALLLAVMAWTPWSAQADPGLDGIGIGPALVAPATAPSGMWLAGPWRLRSLLGAVFGQSMAGIDDPDLLPDADIVDMDVLDLDIGGLRLDGAVADNTPGFRLSLNPDAPDIFVSWQFEF